MNKNLITFENKIIKVLLRNVYKKIDVEITYQFANPYQLITKELKILKNSKHEISSSDLRNLPSKIFGSSNRLSEYLSPSFVNPFDFANQATSPQGLPITFLLLFELNCGSNS